MKRKKVAIPIYDGKLTILSIDDVAEIPDEYELDQDNGYTAMVFEHPTKKEIVVIFHKDVPIKVIAHEAVHIVNFIFIHAGVKLDLYNDEAQAYLTEWAFDVCHNFLIKK